MLPITCASDKAKWFCCKICRINVEIKSKIMANARNHDHFVFNLLL